LFDEKTWYQVYVHNKWMIPECVVLEALQNLNKKQDGSP
jgi:hypothetical protein